MINEKYWKIYEQIDEYMKKYIGIWKMLGNMKNRPRWEVRPRWAVRPRQQSWTVSRKMIFRWKGISWNRGGISWIVFEENSFCAHLRAKWIFVGKASREIEEASREIGFKKCTSSKAARIRESYLGLVVRSAAFELVHFEGSIRKSSSCNHPVEQAWDRMI